MSMFSVFNYGQVWHWDDSIYLTKSAGRPIPDAESTLRYSRAVIIVQRTETTSGSGTLQVVPCSSSNSLSGDVKIEIPYGRTNITYAKIRYMFPVYRNALKRYICTLHPSIMKKIESNMLGLFSPTVYDQLDKDQLEMYDLTVHDPFDDMKDMCTVKNSKIDKLIRSFRMIHLETTGERRDFVPIDKMKCAFDHYCKITGMHDTIDINDFIQRFSIIYQPTGKFDPQTNGYSIIGWSSCRLNINLNIMPRGIILNAINPSDEIENQHTDEAIEINDSIVEDVEENIYQNDTQEIGDTQTVLPVETELVESISETTPKKISWTNDRKLNFIKYYQQHGIEKTSIKYELGMGTCKGYWYKWKELLDEINANEDIKDKLYNDIQFPLNTNEIGETISKLPNIIVSAMIDEDIFESVEKCFYNHTKVSMSPEDFYVDVGSVIYHTLLSYLSIEGHYAGTRLSIPSRQIIMDTIKTWHFLYKLSSEKSISTYPDLSSMIKKYQLTYGADSGIESQWLLMLRHRLTDKMQMIDKGTRIISEFIYKIFHMSNS